MEMIIKYPSSQIQLILLVPVLQDPEVEYVFRSRILSQLAKIGHLTNAELKHWDQRIVRSQQQLNLKGLSHEMEGGIIVVSIERSL